jgi:hypothetical protein
LRNLAHQALLLFKIFVGVVMVLPVNALSIKAGFRQQLKGPASIGKAGPGVNKALIYQTTQI